MNFKNIVIFPPDNYRFLNFVPIVINLYTFREENLKNRLEVSFKMSTFTQILQHLDRNASLKQCVITITKLQ